MRSRLVLLVAIGWCGASGLELRGEDALTFVQTNTLYLQTAKSRILVKRLAPGAVFKGAAVMRNGDVFYSYSGDGPENVTILSIFDVRLKKERFLAELGATSDDSRFIYSKTNDSLVFDWRDGIYVFPMRAAETVASAPDRPDTFDRYARRVALCMPCFDPHWLDDGRVEYWVYEKDGTRKWLQATPPPAQESAGKQ